MPEIRLFEARGQARRIAEHPAAPGHPDLAELDRREGGIAGPGRHAGEEGVHALAGGLVDHRRHTREGRDHVDR